MDKTFKTRQEIADYAGVTLGTDDVAAKSHTKIIGSNNKIDILRCELNAKVEVFDLLGRGIYSSVAKSNKLSIDVNNTIGIYIVKISGISSVISKKVVVY